MATVDKDPDVESSPEVRLIRLIAGRMERQDRGEQIDAERLNSYESNLPRYFGHDHQDLTARIRGGFRLYY